MGAEVAVGRAFAAARRLLRRVLWLDGGGDGGGASGGRLACAGSDTDSPADLLARRMRCRTPPPLPVVAEEEAAAMEAAAAAAAAAAEGSAATARAPRRRALRPPLKSLLRSGRHWEEDLSVWTASDVILREGYPLEQHSVTTSGEEGGQPGGAGWLGSLPGLCDTSRNRRTASLSPLLRRAACGPSLRLPCRRLCAADAPHPAPRWQRRGLLPAWRAGHKLGVRMCMCMPTTATQCFMLTASLSLARLAPPALVTRHGKPWLPPGLQLGGQRRGRLRRLCRL